MLSGSPRWKGGNRGACTLITSAAGSLLIAGSWTGFPTTQNTRSAWANRRGWENTARRKWPSIIVGSDLSCSNPAQPWPSSLSAKASTRLSMMKLKAVICLSFPGTSCRSCWPTSCVSLGWLASAPVRWKALTPLASRDNQFFALPQSAARVWLGTLAGPGTRGTRFASARIQPAQAPPSQQPNNLANAVGK